MFDTVLCCMDALARSPFEAQPDQTALELLIEFRARYPDRYTSGIRALQRRVKVWRREAVQRLICEMKDVTHDVTTAC